VGNVVTGQGNIRVSLVHSQKVTNHLIDNCMPGANRNSGGPQSAAESRGLAQARAVRDGLRSLPTLTPGEAETLERRIRALQERAGYASDYDSWIAKVTPPDLE